MGTKIFYLYTLLILLLITASSCKDDNEDSILSPNVSITLSREDSYPVLPQEGGSVAIPFKAKDEWTARVAGDNETWISISPVKGNAGEASLTISVIANETPDERKATIILESGTSIANIVVTQKRKDISREVLLEFYKSTNGDGWENNTNWCSNKPLSEWYGITTDPNGEVITINLDRNNLIGQLPSNIGDLRRLRYLRLNDNYLYGELPESFYKLTELEYFSVSNFNFGSEGGTIIIDPNNPEAPTLGRNQLSGSISEKIGNLKNLYEFSVLQNMLEGELPKAIWTLPKLKALLLTHNKDLHGEIPEDIGNLQNLVQLWLDGNNFSGELPKAITTLANLEELIIGYNAFTGELPKDIGNLKKLRQFTCGYNLFTGEIPESIYELENILWIEAQGYKSTAAVVWADGTHIIENYNHFDGEFPANLGNLKKLEAFNVSENDLTGEIPDDFYELPQIQTFDIADNNITGTLSEKLGNLKTLNYFRITGCKIEGEIPESVGNMDELQAFVAENNNLTGNVPIGFATLPKFETLFLNGNRLSGVLPKEILDMDMWNTYDIEFVLLPQQDGYGFTIGDYTSQRTRSINHSTVPQMRVRDQITIHSPSGTINIPVKTAR